MQNVERSMHTIALLRSWGFAVAIDDFGTGILSLSYLKRLTVDLIKIDQSFVIGLPDDEQDAALTEMLLADHRPFRFRHAGGGHRDGSPSSVASRTGCRLGQGYLFARPGSFGLLAQRIAAAPAVA